MRDPAVPQAVGGLVYEIDPVTGTAVTRPAVGSRSHEGLRFDALGNLYGISERNPGYIYRFTPDRRGDLSSGQLYALKVTNDDGDNDPLTGSATWVPLDRATVQVDSDAAAAAAGATAYNRPEDVETADSTGNSRGGQALFVAVTGDDTVYKVDLRQPAGGREHLSAAVSTYIRAGSTPRSTSTHPTTSHWITTGTSTSPRIQAAPRRPRRVETTSGWRCPAGEGRQRPRKRCGSPASLTATLSPPAFTSARMATPSTSTSSTAGVTALTSPTP
ncbi:MAG: PhoX family protein [Actinomycetota bacterium]|nr:PhoX family protein [Actinomycetota bacterium]